MMVTDIAGTTVDAIDSDIEWEGKTYRVIDTAGLRRAARRTDDVEILASFKSRDSIDRADIVLLMVDGLIGPTEQDAKIAEMVMERHKGLILVANKLDRGEAERDEFRKTFRDQVANEFHFFSDIPIVFTGLRPGEKLHEQLTSETEETLPTRYEKIRIVRTDAPRPLDHAHDQLWDAVVARADRTILRKLQELVPEFSPQAALIASMRERASGETRAASRNVG